MVDPDENNGSSIPDEDELLPLVVEDIFYELFLNHFIMKYLTHIYFTTVYIVFLVTQLTQDC